MRISQAWLVFTLSLSTSSVLTALPKGHRVKENIDHPRGWVKQAPTPTDHVLELRIGLPQPNFHVLESHLYQVSDPDHPRYGAHLSKEEVEALVAPHPESIYLVDEWLASYGFNTENLVRSPAKDWVTIKVPAQVAEEMLDTVSWHWHMYWPY
jgi:tripeptidyl-peptidase I